MRMHDVWVAHGTGGICLVIADGSAAALGTGPPRWEGDGLRGGTLAHPFVHDGLHGVHGGRGRE